MEKVKYWLSNKCPLIWSILNNTAKNSLPRGILEFINSGSELEIENGKYIFLTIEKNLNELLKQITMREIGDNYRRDLSSITSKQQLSEIFAEIAVCSTISTISDNISLRPGTQGNKSADFRVMISNIQIIGEVKRYIDNWSIKKRESPNSIIKGRSIIGSNDESIKAKTIIPRFVELLNKLKDINKQLSTGYINLIFLFHSSIGNTESYIKQALFGESNFWREKENLVLEKKSLFSQIESRNISALVLCKLNNSGFIDFYESFLNPNANNIIPEDILDKILSA